MKKYRHAEKRLPKGQRVILTFLLAAFAVLAVGNSSSASKVISAVDADAGTLIQVSSYTYSEEDLASMAYNYYICLYPTATITPKYYSAGETEDEGIYEVDLGFEPNSADICFFIDARTGQGVDLSTGTEVDFTQYLPAEESYTYSEEDLGMMAFNYYMSLYPTATITPKFYSASETEDAGIYEVALGFEPDSADICFFIDANTGLGVYLDTGEEIDFTQYLY